MNKYTEIEILREELNRVDKKIEKTEILAMLDKLSGRKKYKNHYINHIENYKENRLKILDDMYQWMHKDE